MLILILMMITTTVTISACHTSVDCSMNGECILPNDVKDPQSDGKCRCFHGWKGIYCDILHLQPIDKQLPHGLQLADNVSTWGGSIIYYDGAYHMYASRIVNKNCGLSTWTTNSEVIHAVSQNSSNPLGPYVVSDVVLPVFAHEPNAMIVPTTGEIVIYVTALPGVKPRNCTTTMNDNSSDGDGDNTRPDEQQQLPPPKDTYMLYSTNGPYGPWSEPVMVFNSTRWNVDYWNKTKHFAICDSNLNGIINIDNSFVGLWRRCETPNLLTIPHVITASNWKDPTTYQPNLNPIFVLDGSGAEDPSNIWTTSSKDTQGNLITAYHVIFHDEQSTRCMLPTGCSSNGRHAFSIDNGKTWTYSMNDAYTRNISYTDNTYLISNTRARPHIVIDPYCKDVDENERDNDETLDDDRTSCQSNPKLLALSTGLKPTSESDYVWTLVQSIQGGDGGEGSNDDEDSTTMVE